MTNRWLLLSAFLVAGVLDASAQVGERSATVTLDVHVDGFENTDGAAGIAVWDAARGFPE